MSYLYVNIIKSAQISWFITMITCTIFGNQARISIAGPESLKNMLEVFRKRERRDCCIKEGEDSPIPICPSVIWEVSLVYEGRRLIQWLKFHKHHKSLGTKEHRLISRGSEVSSFQLLNKMIEFMKHHSSRMCLPADYSYNKPTGVL